MEHEMGLELELELEMELELDLEIAGDGIRAISGDCAGD